MNIQKLIGKIYLSASLFLVMILTPVISFAQNGLTTCSGADCDFAKFVELIEKVIDFMMFKLALPLAAISFAVAGIMMLTAGGSTEKIKQAKDIFWYVFVGILIALSAWLVVSAVTGALLKPGISGLGQ